MRQRQQQAQNGEHNSVREPGLISDPKVNFSYFEIAMGRYGEVWARRNVYSAPPRYYKCTATHATPI